MNERQELRQLRPAVDRCCPSESLSRPIALASSPAVGAFTALQPYLELDASCPKFFPKFVSGIAQISTKCEEMGFPLVSPNTSQRISRLGRANSLKPLVLAHNQSNSLSLDRNTLHDWLRQARISLDIVPAEPQLLAVWPS